MATVKQENKEEPMEEIEEEMEKFMKIDASKKREHLGRAYVPQRVRVNDVCDTYKFWRMRKTALQMCRDRGYDVTKKEIDLTLDKFKDVFGCSPSQGRPSRDDLTIEVKHVDDVTDRLMVIFTEDSPISVATVKRCVGTMNNLDLHHIILVGPRPPSGMANKSIAAFNPTHKIETFLESELMFNVTEHEMVPQHIIITDEEKKELLAKYKMLECQLPCICGTDPVVKYLGGRKGQVMRIERKLEDITHVTYRRVT